MAVNITEVPAQIVPELAVIETDGTRLGLTAMVMLLLVAVVVVRQVALLVTVQVTTSLLFKVVDVNVVELVPVFIPLIFHW